MYRGGVGHRLATQIDANESAQRRRVVQRLLARRIGQVEPVLQQVDAQHALQPDGRAAVAGLGVLSRNRRKFRQPINVACPAPGRWGRPNSRVTSRHFDHGNASRTSRPDCSGLDEAD